MIRPLAIFLASCAPPVAAQDVSGLLEMETACLLNEAHAQHSSKLCDAFRYGISYRDRQLRQQFGSAPQVWLDSNGTQTFRSMEEAQGLNTTGSGAAGAQIIIPPAALSARSNNQIVR